MNKYLSLLAFLLLLAMVPFVHALELPKEQTFEIKNVKDLNVLYVHHDQSKGHISNTLIKLIQYYLLKDER
ncbi:hypothetical protein [Candidatus Spongiihabitans sp.]|uniref:hypothetical protein n=1 Tax=Candidatus Spongiihabitans sp. TaxID=3101308 RepID=UPI003C6F2C76